MNDAAPQWPPPGIDPDVPSTARVYDAALGGKNNFKADREAVEVFERLIPQVREATWLNRKALIRGIQYLVRAAGVDRVEVVRRDERELQPAERVVVARAAADRVGLVLERERDDARDRRVPDRRRDAADR